MVRKSIYLLKHSFFKFAVVGLLGTISNLSIFYIFVDIFGLWANVFAVVSFMVAGAQNYILHHKWTFGKIMKDEKLSFLGYVKFIITTAFGLVINLIVLNLILYFFDVPYKVIAQGCGVAFGTVFNYFGSKRFVFKKGEISENI
jgi:putative flippase GtrA